MPDTPKNQAQYPQQKSQKPGVGLPIARAVAVAFVGDRLRDGLGDGAVQGQRDRGTALLRSMLGSLAAGDIAVMDRYYCSFMMIALLLAQGTHTCARKHHLRHSRLSPRQATGQVRSHHRVFDDPPNTNEYENKVSHAVVTAIVPAVFNPALLPALPELGMEANDPVFGVDANVFDYFNVDTHSFVDFDDGPEHDWTAFVCTDCDNLAEGGLTNSVDTVVAVTARY